MALQRQFTVFCYFNNAVRPSVLKLKKLDKIKRPYLKDGTGIDDGDDRDNNDNDDVDGIRQRYQKVKIYQF